MLLIVATDVLLELQVAKFVMSTGPLQVVAVAVNGCVLPCVTVGLGGVTAMDWMHGTVTVRVAVFEIEGSKVEVAVTVA